MKFEKSAPHPYSDVLQELRRAQAMDPGRGTAKIDGLSINDLIRAVHDQTEAGRAYAERRRAARG